MHYSKVTIAAFGYELAPHVIRSDDLERRLAPLYRTCHFKIGQLEALTGVRERRFWEPGFAMFEGASLAGKKALDEAGIAPGDIGMLAYCGVCRDNLEPATACAVADRLGVGADAEIFDISNACLGVLNGMVKVANAIELGQITAGLVVSCESARQIVDTTIQRLVTANDMETFKRCVATLTGGSGAVAVVLADSRRMGGHRLLGGVMRNAVRHHGLCRWGPDTGVPASAAHVMETDSVAVLQNGVTLGIETFAHFKQMLGWSEPMPDKIICHQVGDTHQRTILTSLGIAPEKDFTTFRHLGNIGTVSLPITAAIADERGFFQDGDRVGFLGIGSGLNCLMLGVQW